MLIHSANVIIIVGNMILHRESIRDMLDVKVYVETDEDVRLSRRVMTHIKEIERNNSLEDFLEAYFRFVKPAHEEFIEPSKKYADIIIPNYGFTPDTQLGRTLRLIKSRHGDQDDRHQTHRRPDRSTPPQHLVQTHPTRLVNPLHVHIHLSNSSSRF